MKCRVEETEKWRCFIVISCSDSKLRRDYLVIMSRKAERSNVYTEENGKLWFSSDCAKNTSSDCAKNTLESSTYLLPSHTWHKILNTGDDEASCFLKSHHNFLSLVTVDKRGINFCMRCIVVFNSTIIILLCASVPISSSTTTSQEEESTSKHHGEITITEGLLYNSSILLVLLVLLVLLALLLREIY